MMPLIIGIISFLFSTIAHATSNFSDIADSVSNKFKDQDIITQANRASQLYIDTFSWSFEDWQNNSPILSGDPIPYYADDEKYPVALEWKVQCNRNENCGRIIVSTDKSTPIVIESATQWRANYETLASGRTDSKNKFYYFSPFEQYVDIDDPNMEDVVALSPWEKITRAGLQDKQQKNRDARIAKKLLDTPREDIVDASFGVGTVVKNIPSVDNGTTCASPIPCYQQFPTTYANWSCAVWCWPTALTQIFAYHDRRGTFPNLFPNTVADPLVMDESVANSIGVYMGTYCTPEGWATVFSNERYGLQYARDRGYVHTVLPSLIESSIFYNIRMQVNRGRPVIVNALWSPSGHIFVAYGWNTDTVWLNQIHVNYGWGPGVSDAWITVSNLQHPLLNWMTLTSILPVVITP